MLDFHSSVCGVLREIIVRFLRAVKWASAQAAIKRLEGTLKWRREFGVYDLITASHVEPEVCLHYCRRDGWPAYDDA